MSVYISKEERFRLPEWIIRVTAGSGGEAFLIDGGGQAVLYDTGMAFCHAGLIRNIESALTGLGYEAPSGVFLSHTHYDHIGALPYVLERWPDLTVYGAAKAAAVFASTGALATMKRLGRIARDLYGTPEERQGEIRTSGFRLDHALVDGEEITIGTRRIRAVFTPGHTDCSMSYLLLPERTLFLSESLGVPTATGGIEPAMLKSLDQCLASAEKCRELQAEDLVFLHFGRLPKEQQSTYFDRFRAACLAERDMVLAAYREGCSREEILRRFTEMYWNEKRGWHQPLEAFQANAVPIIEQLIRNA